MTTEILLVDDEQAIANVLVRSLSARTALPEVKWGTALSRCLV